MFDWKEEFRKKLSTEEICTDSDIEDFIGDYKYAAYKQTKILVKDFDTAVWKYFYELRAEGTPCEGCKFIGYWGMSPCLYCTRKVNTKDYYIKENN